jgi:hypothetical protein
MAIVLVACLLIVAVTAAAQTIPAHRGPSWRYTSA